MVWDKRVFNGPLLRWWLAGLCVVVFAATAMAVYSHFLHETENRFASERPKTTAIVRIQALGELPESDPRPRIVTPDVRALRQEMTSESTFAQVLRGLGTLPTGVASLRERLDVEVTESATPREIRVAISCSDTNGKLATDVVNLLAQRYADGCRNKLRADMEQVCTVARDAATRARSEQAAAKAALEGFLGAFFRQVDATAKADPGVSQPRKDESKPTATIENPRWADLKQELAQLQEHRDELLVKKTSLHPDVQRQDEKIAEIKVRLAAIPQRIPQVDSLSRVVSPSVPASPKTSVPTLESREAIQSHQRLRTALDRADAACERTAQAERAAWEARTHLPRVELVPAEPMAGLPAGGMTAGLFWITMAVASTMAVGVGLAAMGVVADPPLSTVDEVQDALPVPVVAVFHADGLPDEPVVKHAAPRSRFPWIASGAMLIVGSIAIAMATW